MTVSAAGSYAPVEEGEPAGPAGASSSSSRQRGSSARSSSGSRSGRAAVGGRGGARCPVLVRASIEGGELEAWGARLPLPIR